MRSALDPSSKPTIDFEGEIDVEQVEVFFNSDRYGGRHRDLEAEAIEDARSFPDEDIDELRLRASMRQAGPHRDLRIPAAMIAFVGAMMITLSIGGILRATVTLPDLTALIFPSSDPARASTEPAMPSEPVHTDSATPISVPADTAKRVLDAPDASNMPDGSNTPNASAMLDGSETAKTPETPETPETGSATLDDIVLPDATGTPSYALDIAAQADADPNTFSARWRAVADALPGRSLLITHQDAPHAVLLFTGPEGLTAAPANLPAMPDARPVLWQVSDAGLTRFVADLGNGPVTIPGMTLEPGKRFLVSLEPDGPVAALPEGPIVMQAQMLEAS
ncbi:MAG: hypothetical protein AAGC92_15280 [Pseudomonadota bacterium]